MLAVLVLAWADAHHWPGQPLYSFPAARLPEFVLGAAVARLVLLGRWRGPGLEASLAVAIIGYFLVPGGRPAPAASGDAAQGPPSGAAQHLRAALPGQSGVVEGIVDSGVRPAG
ncbi:hypothetical protein [Streptomyces chartreusis]|uniref:hypothetical protein n=1 Tax=Streptomyces chartreusis TaxID=1969 RepID=UPI003F53F096